MRVSKRNEGFSPIYMIAAMLIIAAIGILAYVAYRTIVKKPNTVLPSLDQLAAEKEVSKTDEHGCNPSRGETWCEVLGTCLKASDGPCEAPDLEELVKEYLTANISELSPIKEVLGGKYQVTAVRFGEEGQAEVDYEDGHIAFTAKIKYAIDANKVYVRSFSILDPDKALSKLEEKSTSSEEVLDEEGDTLFLAELKTMIYGEYGGKADVKEVRVTDNRGTFLRGEMDIVIDGAEESGDFFALKTSVGYTISDIGTDGPDCVLLADFPSDMVPECPK